MKHRLEWTIFLLCLAGVLGVVIYYFGPPLYHNVKTRLEIREFMKQAPQIRAEWNKEFGPLEDFPKQFPKQKKNDSAVHVELLFAKLGLDTENAVIGKLSEYTKSQLESTEPGLADPPKELVDFFNKKQTEIHAYRKQLIDEPIPQWDINIGEGYISPLPNLLMHVVTQKLFTVGAFLELKAGRVGEANGYLEAGWKLSQGLKSRPELTCQLIYIASARYEIGILRRLNEFPDVWRERLLEMDAKASLHRSMAMEVYSTSVGYTQLANGEMKLDDRHSIRNPSASDSDKQFLAASLLDMQKLMTWLVKGAENLDVCNQTKWPAEHEFENLLEPWDVLSAIAIPGVDSNWKRANRLRLDAEATSKVFQARAVHTTAADHLWPAAIPGIESTVCKDQRWIYQTTPDRKSMTLHYSSTLDWPGHKGPMLPMQFSE